MEDAPLTPAAEKPTAPEQPGGLPTPELQEVTLLPAPPADSEASASGPADLNVVLWLSTASAAEALEEQTALENAPEDVLITEDISPSVPEGDVAEEPHAEDTEAQEEEHLDVVVADEVEIPEVLQISTIATETREQELPALVPAPDIADSAGEASHPEAEETSPGSEDSNPAEVPPANEAEQSEDHTDVAVDLTALEEPVLKEGGTESEGKNAPPAPAEETPEAPKISTEDLLEDEILLVNEDGPEAPVTESLSPAEPTALSPERESPFTWIADAKPASEGPPDIFSPSLVEVNRNENIFLPLQFACCPPKEKAHVMSDIRTAHVLFLHL